MKTGAMRRFVGIDAPDSEPGKAMQIAKKVGHGLESVSNGTLLSLLKLIYNALPQVAYRLPIPFLGRVVGALNKPVSAIRPVHLNLPIVLWRTSPKSTQTR
jgi:hypothetical protein